MRYPISLHTHYIITVSMTYPYPRYFKIMHISVSVSLSCVHVYVTKRGRLLVCHCLSAIRWSHSLWRKLLWPCPPPLVATGFW